MSSLTCFSRSLVQFLKKKTKNVSYLVLEEFVIEVK